MKHLHPILAIGLLLLFTVTATYHGGMHWQYDFPSYHLPFLLRDWQLSSWELWPNLLPIWEGYPPLAHGIQAGLIALSGLSGYANLINILALVAMTFAVRAMLPTLRLGLLIVGMLAMPLFILNLPTGGLDIAFAAAVLVQFVALTQVIAGDHRARCHHLFIAATGFSILSKMNGWAVSFAFATTYTLVVIWPYARAAFRAGPTSFAVPFSTTMLRLILLALLVGYWPLHNWAIYGSPIWPLGIPGVTALGLDPRGFFNPIVRPDMFAKTPLLLRYLISFFELSQLVTWEPMRWSATMWHEGPQSPHQMMGGLNGLYMIALTVYFVVLMRRRKPARAEWLLLLATVLIAGSLAQSHEMRYSFYVPMILLYLCVKYTHTLNGWSRLHTLTLLALTMAGATHDVRGTHIFDLSKKLYDGYPIMGEFWQVHANDSGPACIPETPSHPSLSEPLGVYFSGPHLREIKAKLCRTECALPWHPCPFEW